MLIPATVLAAAMELAAAKAVIAAVAAGNPVSADGAALLAIPAAVLSTAAVSVTRGGDVLNASPGPLPLIVR